jgi:hypothetical protein
MSIKGGFRATGIYDEETLDLVSSYLENFLKKVGREARGCHVLSVRAADRTAQKLLLAVETDPSTGTSKTGIEQCPAQVADRGCFRYHAFGIIRYPLILSGRFGAKGLLIGCLRLPDLVSSLFMCRWCVDFHETYRFAPNFSEAWPGHGVKSSFGRLMPGPYPVPEL